MSKCTGQPRSAQAISGCEAGIANPRCGRLVQNLWNCQVEKQVCGPDGKTDLAAMEERCGSEQGAVEWCELEGG